MHSGFLDNAPDWVIWCLIVEYAAIGVAMVWMLIRSFFKK